MTSSTGIQPTAHDLAGGRRIFQALSRQEGEHDLVPLQRAQQAARRFALLDELDADGTAADGLTWLEVHALMGQLGIEGGARATFWSDVEWLRSQAYIQLRWEVHPWPAGQASKGLTISVVRVRETLLRHPRLRRAGSIATVARSAGLDVSRLQRLVGRSSVIDLTISPTRAAVHLVRQPRRAS